MRMDGQADVGDFGLHLDGKCGFGNQVAGMRTDDADADDAMRGLVVQHLGEAFGATDADGTTRRRPREHALAVSDAFRLRFGFGESDPGDFRIGVGHARDHPRDEFALVAAGILRSNFRFVRGLVREHRLADDVTDREDVRHVRAHLLVDGDEAACIDVHTRRFGVELLAIRRAPDRTQHAIEHRRFRHRLAFEGGVQTILLRIERGDLGLQMDTGVTLRESRLQRLDEIKVGTRHQLVGEFDDGDFRTERIEYAGHFQADDAAADDEQALRDIGERQGIGRVHHARIVPAQARQFHRLRTGGDDGFLEAHELGTVRGRDFDLVRRNELRDAGHARDLALFRHAGEAAVQGLHDLFLVRAQLVEFDLRRTEADAVVRGVAGFVDHFRGVQQCLRRNAADVEADATEFGITLDQHDVLVQIRRAERRAVSARPGADHDDLALDVGFAAARGRCDHGRSRHSDLRCWSGFSRDALLHRDGLGRIWIRG